MGEVIERFGMGWLPDYPDFRDYTIDRVEVSSKLERLGQKDSVKTMLTKIGVAGPVKANLPEALNEPVDLRRWCSPVENQGTLGSCTAHAAVGMVEYFERRAFNKHIDASRLFLYKATRNMLNWTGDTGAFIRTTMGALVLFGVPPEEYCPYVIADFDLEPSAFCYAYAQNYQAMSYYRLDRRLTIPSEQLLGRIKRFLAAGLPSMFGFTVYSSYTQARRTGEIPYPTPGESRVAGHAVLAVGYDDNKKIENTNADPHPETTGALLIRNSWGTGWGSAGYGWLPYKYVLQGLAVDWWSLLRNEWVDTEKFKLHVETGQGSDK